MYIMMYVQKFFVHTGIVLYLAVLELLAMADKMIHSKMSTRTLLVVSWTADAQATNKRNKQLYIHVPYPLHG